MDAVIVLPRGDASSWLQGRLLAPVAASALLGHACTGHDVTAAFTSPPTSPHGSPESVAPQRCAFAARVDRDAHACLCPADGSRRHMHASAVLWPSGVVVGCGVVVWTGGSMVRLSPLDAADAHHAHDHAHEHHGDGDRGGDEGGVQAAGSGGTGAGLGRVRLHAGGPASASLSFTPERVVGASSASRAALRLFPDVFGAEGTAASAPDALLVIGTCAFAPGDAAATGLDVAVPAGAPADATAASARSGGVGRHGGDADLAAGGGDDVAARPPRLPPAGPWMTARDARPDDS